MSGGGVDSYREKGVERKGRVFLKSCRVDWASGRAGSELVAAPSPAQKLQVAPVTHVTPATGLFPWRLTPARAD